jgi:hypothetical protein
MSISMAWMPATAKVEMVMNVIPCRGCGAWMAWWLT